MKHIEFIKPLGKWFLLAAVAFSATFAKAQWYGLKGSSRASWGPDNRAEAKTKWEYRDYMRATATAVKLWQVNGDKVFALNFRDRLTYELKGHNMDPTGQYNFDPSVRFLDQPSCGSCTGFLIAPDILVTAGHCITTQGDLDSTVWLFDFTSDVPFDAANRKITIPTSNQYRGVELLDRELLGSAGWDYCIIRLDRKVTGRKPYKFRTNNELQLNAFIAMIGSPRGLPLKVVDSARCTNPNEKSTYFLTNLTAFHGNSGGPVFNSNGWIEGILVRAPHEMMPIGGEQGDYDFHYDSTCQCIKQDVYFDLYGYLGMKAENGGEVHKIMHTNYNLLLYAVYRNQEVAIEDNNAEEFKEWSLYQWIWTLDLAGRDEKYKNLDNLVAKAIKYDRADFVSQIFDVDGMDFNIMDLYKTPILNLMVDHNMGENIVKALTKSAGALDVNKADANGETPLMVAARNGNMELIELLLSNGADAKLKNIQGKTARQVAKDAKKGDAAKRLKKAEKAAKAK